MGAEQTKTLQFEFKQDIPYEVISEKDETVLVAICPKLSISGEKTYLVWFDTVKDRTKEIAAIINDTPDMLRFKTPDDKDYLLRPLSYQVFQDRVLPKLHLPQNISIQTEQDMITNLMNSLNYE